MRKGLAGGKLVMKGWIGLLCGCVVACKSMNADERIQMFDLLFLSNLDILDRVEGL
jgi:Na+/serine symporter